MILAKIVSYLLDLLDVEFNYLASEVYSSLVEGALYSTLGDYDNSILIDACQTELSSTCAETSEVASVLVENAGEMTESLGAVAETAVGHVFEALTSFST